MMFTRGGYVFFWFAFAISVGSEYCQLATLEVWPVD